MAHSAFDTAELIRGCPSRIDCVAMYGSKIILGTSDGYLRIYASSTSFDSSDDGEVRRGSYVVDREVRGFWRRSPAAMEVCGRRELLLSLSESVAFHRLPNLEAVTAIAKTKGANAYGWDDRRGLLCVARQKRITIFRHDGGRGFEELKEYGIPDAVKSMAWCGENICLGIRREYVIMNSATGALSEVFPLGRIVPPSVVSLPSGELLLGKDNIGVFVDQNGKLLQDGRIVWSEAPASVVIQMPYVIARLPRFIEVRSFRAPYQLVQQVALRDVRLLTLASNCVIAVLDNSVYGLLPVPITAQIVQLTACGIHELEMDGFSPFNAGIGSLLLDDPFSLSELMDIDGYTDLCSPLSVDQGVPSFGLPAQLMVQQSWSPLMPLNNLMQMNSDGSFDTTGVSPSDRGRPMNAQLNSPSNFVSVDSGMKGKENSFVSEDVAIPRSLSVSFSLADKMLRALSLFKESSGGGILAQVWVPLKHGNDYILSTCEQPYLLDGLLAGYREVSRAFTFSTRESPDSFPGLPGRVFISRMPEWTTNVIYYSKAEYLRVNHAITHEVRGSLAVPVFDPHDRSCHAVLELVTTIEKSNFDPEMKNVSRALRAVDLTTTEVRPHSQNLSRSQRAAIAEIVDVLRAICHAHMLPLALTWVPSCCKDAVTGECMCDSVKERSIDLHRKSLLRIEESACYVNDATMHGFVHACFEHHLKQGQGIAGKALQSNHPFFSPDVKVYDILDYPLAHHARKFGLNAAVAIRLRSTFTGSNDYILEFFLPVNCRGSAEQQLLLNNLSVTMQKICRSLRTVSDAEIGIVDNKECVPKGSGLCFPLTGISGGFSQSEPSTCGPLSRSENKGSSGTGEDICHGQTVCQKSEKKRSTSEKNISLSILQQYFSGSLKDAAKAIGVCPTTLKRICRQHGISRWPSRKINKVNRSLNKIQNVINSVQGVEGALKFDPVSGRLVSAVSNLEPPRDIDASSPKKQFVGKLEPEECLGPIPSSTTNDASHDRNTSSSSMGAEQMVVAEPNHSAESATTESSNGTTSSSPDFMAALHHRKPATTGEVLVVKATYKDDTVRFKFSPTIGCLHLFEEVGRRFKLLTGMFQLKYLDDEEEWVMLANESDLQECVEVLECGGTRNLKLLVKDLPCLLGSSASSNCLSMGS